MKKFFLFVFVFISGWITAQSLLVPYRKGQLWGLSDTLGNIVCTPNYEHVYFPNEDRSFSEMELPPFYFILKNGNKFGVYADKEIIAPHYTSIQCVDDAFFACSDNENHLANYWFSLDGTSLLPSGHIIQRLIGKFGQQNVYGKPRYYCYITKSTAATYGIYYFDTQVPSRSRFLVKDCHRIQYERDELTHEMELLVDISINVSKPHGHLRYNKQKEEMELFYESGKDYSARVNEIQNSPVQEGHFEDFNGEPEMVIEERAPSSEIKKEEIQIHTYMRSRFLKNADSLKVEMINTRYIRSGKTYRYGLIQLPKEAKNCMLKNYTGFGSYGDRRADTLFQYLNYVTFDLRDKIGLLVSEKASPFYADSLLQIKTDGFNESGYSFLVGQKNKSGKMLFGWMTAEGKEIIPPTYEDIQFRSSFVSPEYNYASDKWIVKKGNKLGMIHPDGSVVLELKYDAIHLSEQSFSSPVFRLLKKENKYGLYYRENDGIFTGKEWILVEPFSPYKISRLHFIPRGKAKNENYFTLFRLEDESGNFIGYSSRSGTNYFEN